MFLLFLLWDFLAPGQKGVLQLKHSDENAVCPELSCGDSSSLTRRNGLKLIFHVQIWAQILSDFLLWFSLFFSRAYGVPRNHAQCEASSSSVYCMTLVIIFHIPLLGAGTLFSLNIKWTCDCLSLIKSTLEHNYIQLQKREALKHIYVVRARHFINVGNLVCVYNLYIWNVMDFF